MLIEVGNVLNNETTANLGIAGVYTGSARQVAQNSTANNGIFARGNNFNAHFISDQVSAANGAQIQGSQDWSTNWRVVAQTALTASTPATLTAVITYPFYRVVLTNGGVATTALSITSSITL